MSEITIKFAYNGVQDVNKIADQAKKEVEEFNNKGYQTVEEMIELSLKTKTLITLVNNQYRGFSKSTGLAKKAKELDAKLIVGHRFMAEELQRSGYPATYLRGQGACRGVKFPNGFLVDEGVDIGVIEELSMRYKFLGGFSRL